MCCVVVEDPHHEQQMGLVKWAHHKCGHLGEKATYRWAQDHGIVINLGIIKTVTAQCPIWQIWQMDYIGPLPAHRGCQYVCTAVDTYSGYLIAHP
uniref:Integrase catalytic domain-containing protein n=1 Tax=Strigops habroptila TaxID=2489341 RepID=A0A672ULR0_STRHB